MWIVISEFINLPTALIFCMLLFLLVYPAWEFWRIQERFAYRYKLMVFVTLAISMITPVFAILGILCLKMGLLSAVSSKLLFQGMVSVILYPFEGREYYGYEHIDEYLTQLYGNYMELPPPEERKFHLELIDHIVCDD